MQTARGSTEVGEGQWHKVTRKSRRGAGRGDDETVYVEGEVPGSPVLAAPSGPIFEEFYAWENSGHYSEKQSGKVCIVCGCVSSVQANHCLGGSENRRLTTEPCQRWGSIAFGVMGDYERAFRKKYEPFPDEWQEFRPTRHEETEYVQKLAADAAQVPQEEGPPSWVVEYENRKSAKRKIDEAYERELADRRKKDEAYKKAKLEWEAVSSKFEQMCKEQLAAMNMLEAGLAETAADYNAKKLALAAAEGTLKAVEALHADLLAVTKKHGTLVVPGLTAALADAETRLTSTRTAVSDGKKGVAELESAHETWVNCQKTKHYLTKYTNPQGQ